MFCQVCRKFSQIADSGGPFVRGTNRFRKDPIKTYDSYAHHKTGVNVKEPEKIQGRRQWQILSIKWACHVTLFRTAMLPRKN